MRKPLFILLTVLGTLIAQAQDSKSTWQLVEVSSENSITAELATMAFDDDPETQWHTRWHDTRGKEAATPPHSITIDLQAATTIGAFRIRTRAHGEGGFPKRYRLETGMDGKTWGTVAAGEFSYRSRMTAHDTVELIRPQTIRYFRLTIYSIYESKQAKDQGLVISEIDISKDASTLTPTTYIPIPQSREWNYGGYHWKTRHRELIKYSQSIDPQIVFMGDSITHRWGAPPFDETPGTGKAIWNQYYAHRKALNLGYGWDRVENMIWRVQHGELDHTDPRLVVVMAGTNNLEVNTPEEIAKGISHLCINILQKKPNAQILLLAVFPRGQDSYTKELNTLNERLEKLDPFPSITFKDIGAVFLNDQGKLTRNIMPDLLHPGEEGYRRWAEAIEPEISKILGDKIRN
jgi:lysophospholipase L1-like esterase